MHIKGKSSWIKHLDFILLNLLSVIVSFSIAYFIKFNDFGFVSSNSWRTALVLMCLINLVVTFMTNPYSGIFRRPYYEDAIKLAFFTVYSFIIVSILFYIMKVGAMYSRITIVLTFFIYYVIAFLFTYIRKKMLLSGKVKGFSNRKRKLFIVSDYKNIEETEENALASDMAEFEIVGYCFVDGIFNEKLYKGKEVVDVEWVADHVITEHIDDVFIASDPTVLTHSSYKKLTDNEVTVNISIESLTGIEGDDQFISRVGVYKTASIGPYAFDGKRMAYLTVKRVCDFFFGILGCVILVPLMVVVKICNVLWLFGGDSG